MAYLKNCTDNFFQMFFMGTSWVAVSIINLKTRASREMTSRKKSFDFNGVNVAKHWHVAGRGSCHLWLPCYICIIAPCIECEPCDIENTKRCYCNAGVCICLCLCVCLHVVTTALYHTITSFYRGRLAYNLFIEIAGYGTCTINKYHANRSKVNVNLTEIAKNTKLGNDTIKMSNYS